MHIDEVLKLEPSLIYNEYEEVYSLGIDNIQRVEVWEYKTFGSLPKNEKN